MCEETARTSGRKGTRPLLLEQDISDIKIVTTVNCVIYATSSQVSTYDQRILFQKILHHFTLGAAPAE